MSYNFDGFLQKVAGYEADKRGDPYMSRSVEKGGGGWGEARGKFQFRKKTWNDLGYSDDQIWSPQAQEAAANKLAQQNYAVLANKFGRPPSEGEMLHAWHYGPGATQAGATERQAYGGGYKGAHGGGGSAQAPLAQAGGQSPSQSQSPAGVSQASEQTANTPAQPATVGQTQPGAGEATQGEGLRAPPAAKPIQKRDLSGEQQDVMAMLGAKRGSFIFPQFGTNLLKGFS
ncbi:hypothetical protein DPQ22_00510 [Candidatus Tokpelaia sp.]|nr:hypothetical protein DPQ22_00510 [Candidatus Tokpelaia sp.]